MSLCSMDCYEKGPSPGYSLSNLSEFSTDLEPASMFTTPRDHPSRMTCQKTTPKFKSCGSLTGFLSP
ncbi:hypothetical protein BGZ89_009393 [Linnemannia elongata]|nr:hypothetical protein BGZ89_009393 [Linnemannia elongata]